MAISNTTAFLWFCAMNSYALGASFCWNCSPCTGSCTLPWVCLLAMCQHAWPNYLRILVAGILCVRQTNMIKCAKVWRLEITTSGTPTYQVHNGNK
eukprot:5852152-Amphidinium_carterae.1